MPLLAARDYTGVSTRELGEVFQKYFPKRIKLETFAESIGFDERDLKRIVVMQTYQFVGLDKADRILLGLGLNISHLVELGELTVIPAWNDRAAAQMAGDEFWVQGVEPTPEELVERAAELRKLRAWVLGPKTEHQMVTHEAERSRKR